MARPLALAALLALALLAPRSAGAEGPGAATTSVATDLPAGAYRLDRAHASLTFRVNHLGFSNYTARFTDFDASLTLDPAHPQTAEITATVNPASLTLDNPPPGFEADLRGPAWLDAQAFPKITFQSRRVEMTGPNSARIIGDFTLHGVTRPVVLEAVFNGGYAGHPMDPHARIGFSARGALNRSEFGIAYGIPQPGSKMGVSDGVEVIIEAEFNGPDWKRPAG